jgi:hypothetical protein
MKALKYFFISLALISLLSGCSDSSSSDSSGSLSVKVTDAPFPSDIVSEANVTIDKIEIRQSNNTDENPFVTLSESEQTFNLLELSNGITKSLVEMEIEEGSYDLVRLYVADAEAVLSDGTKYDLKVPSGAQTGIKIFINPSIEVTGGLASELLLDFDVSESFVAQGTTDTAAGINGFIFKPAIKAANLSTSGRLTGEITDNLEAVPGAEVSVYEAGTLYTSTIANDSGEYTVLGLPEGNYDIIVEHKDYTSVSFEEVEVTAGNATTLDAELGN